MLVPELLDEAVDECESLQVYESESVGMSHLAKPHCSLAVVQEGAMHHSSSCSSLTASRQNRPCCITLNLLGSTAVSRDAAKDGLLRPRATARHAARLAPISIAMITAEH